MHFCFPWDYSSYPQHLAGQQVECVKFSLEAVSKRHYETLQRPDKVPLIRIGSRLVNIPHPLASTLFTEARPSQLSKA